MAQDDPPDDRSAKKRGPGDGDLDWGNYLSYGTSIAIGVGLGVLVGGWLDRKYGWGPWGTVVGSMLGLASGLYLLIRDALRMNKD